MSFGLYLFSAEVEKYISPPDTLEGLIILPVGD